VGVRLVRAGLALGGVVAGCGVILACSATPKLVGAGGDCFQATDCQEGLVCAPDMTMGGKRTCTSDLTSIQKVPMMPTADAGPKGEAGPDAPSDAPISDAPVSDAPIMMADTAPPDDAATE
jgi:hypothetical protein